MSIRIGEISDFFAKRKPSKAFIWLNTVILILVTLLFLELGYYWDTANSIFPSASPNLTANSHARLLFVVYWKEMAPKILSLEITPQNILWIFYGHWNSIFIEHPTPNIVWTFLGYSIKKHYVQYSISLPRNNLWMSHECSNWNNLNNLYGHCRDIHRTFYKCSCRLGYLL